MPAALIYHICKKSAWESGKNSGTYVGSSQDVNDGFIHFSTADQIAESATKHRSGQKGLVLLAVDPGRLGTSLRWEPSRAGRLFPHLYGDLLATAVVSVVDLPLDEDGAPVIPDLG